MRSALAPGLGVAKSAIHGKGCFATVRFARRKKIAEYTGERITNAEAERRGHRRVLRISGLDWRWSIDGAAGGNGTHYINHSCRPNSFMQTFGRPSACARAARHPPRRRDHGRLRVVAALRPQALHVQRAELPRHDQQADPAFHVFASSRAASHSSIAVSTSAGFSCGIQWPAPTTRSVRSVQSRRIGSASRESTVSQTTSYVACKKSTGKRRAAARDARGVAEVAVVVHVPGIRPEEPVRSNAATYCARSSSDMTRDRAARRRAARAAEPAAVARNARRRRRLALVVGAAAAEQRLERRRKIRFERGARAVEILLVEQLVVPLACRILRLRIHVRSTSGTSVASVKPREYGTHKLTTRAAQLGMMAAKLHTTGLPQSWPTQIARSARARAAARPCPARCSSA